MAISDFDRIMLNKSQTGGIVHPLTCDRKSKNCEVHTRGNDFTLDGVLIATRQKWVCPCGDYKQEYKK